MSLWKNKPDNSSDDDVTKPDDDDVKRPDDDDTRTDDVKKDNSDVTKDNDVIHSGDVTSSNDGVNNFTTETTEMEVDDSIFIPARKEVCQFVPLGHSSILSDQCGHSSFLFYPLSHSLFLFYPFGHTSCLFYSLGCMSSLIYLLGQSCYPMHSTTVHFYSVTSGSSVWSQVILPGTHVCLATSNCLVVSHFSAKLRKYITVFVSELGAAQCLEIAALLLTILVDLVG